MIKISIFQVIYFYSFSKIRLTAKAFEDTDAEYVPDLSQSDFDMFFFFFFINFNFPVHWEHVSFLLWITVSDNNTLEITIYELIYIFLIGSIQIMR